jgi:hypothetical protein
VDFESPEEAGRALREKDHKVFAEKFGDRYVRLIQVGGRKGGANGGVLRGGGGERARQGGVRQAVGRG